MREDIVARRGRDDVFYQLLTPVPGDGSKAMPRGKGGTGGVKTRKFTACMDFLEALLSNFRQWAPSFPVRTKPQGLHIWIV